MRLPSRDTPEHTKQFVDTGELRAMLLSYNWLSPSVVDAIAHGADKNHGVHGGTEYGGAGGVGGASWSPFQGCSLARQEGGIFGE